MSGKKQTVLSVQWFNCVISRFTHMPYISLWSKINEGLRKELYKQKHQNTSQDQPTNKWGMPSSSITLERPCWAGGGLGLLLATLIRCFFPRECLRSSDFPARSSLSQAVQWARSSVLPSASQPWNSFRWSHSFRNLKINLSTSSSIQTLFVSPTSY